MKAAKAHKVNAYFTGTDWSRSHTSSLGTDTEATPPLQEMTGREATPPSLALLHRPRLLYRKWQAQTVLKCGGRSPKLI